MTALIALQAGRLVMAQFIVPCHNLAALAPLPSNKARGYAFLA
jgi:hypothetical protein